MYFSSIVGFQYHPKNPGTERMELEACAKIADRMLLIHIARANYRSERPWATGQQ